MDFNEFADKIKTKYPDYADMDNRELAQKMVAKFPNDYGDVTFGAPYQQPAQADSNTGDVAAQAVVQAGKEALMQPGTLARDLATDPVTQAKALPYIAGTAGAIAPIPGGASLGQDGGRLLSDAALASYGRQDAIPPIAQQVAEGAGALAGDVLALPGIKKGIYGRQIGAAEKAAGVPPPQDIASLPRPGGAQPVSQAIDEAIQNIKTVPDAQKTPVFWKQIKDQVDWFYGRGKDEVISKMDKAKLAWLSNAAQDGLNAAVPGRAIPAQAMARSQAIPNAVNGAWNMLPRRTRAGIGYLSPAILAEYATRKFIK